MKTQIALILAAICAVASPGSTKTMSTIPEPYSLVVCPATAEHPRNGEADMIRLKDGSLFLAYGRWNGGQDDFDTAEVWCKTSSDGGKTWGNDRVLVPNEGKLTTFSVSLLRLKSGEILMAYLVKDNKEDCSIYFRKSEDECRTWSDRVKFQIPAEYSGYTGMNNNRLIQLKSGRIVGAAWDGFAKGHHMLGFTVYSDDNGATWHKSNDVDMRVLDPNEKVGAQEPLVVELKDGKLMMFIRNGFGCIARSYSTDKGETWSKPELVKELEAPVAPASVARIPQTGDLLLIWNHNKSARRPLNSAISKDEGKTWQNIRVLDDGDGPAWPGFAYTSITPVDDNIVITYWYHEAAGTSLKLKILDYRWFYQAEH